MKRQKGEVEMNSSFAKNIIELKLVSDRIAEGKGKGAGVFTVRYQLLYLISSKEKISPQELIEELKMAKSNLALITRKMIKEGVITSFKEEGNRKQIYYRITPTGKKELKSKMDAINNMQTEESKEMLMHLVKTVESLKNVK